MDAFDYAETQKARPPRNTSGLVWNILTVATLLGVLCVGIVFLNLYFNPYASINPFPPPTDVPTATPYMSPTPQLGGVLPPTWTPSPTPEPSPTRTPRDTATPFVLPTATETVDPKLTKTPGSGMSYSVQPGTPSAIPGQPFHPEAGCNWLGVAGYVYDLSGGQVKSMEVHVGGVLAGVPVNMVTLTGLLTNSMGAGYYEFTLGNAPIASSKTLWVQLIDPQGGLVMSDKVYFDTYDTCDKNMILINFNQVKK